MANRNDRPLPATAMEIELLQRQSEEDQQRRMALYSERPTNWNSAFESNTQDRTTSNDAKLFVEDLSADAPNQQT